MCSFANWSRNTTSLASSVSRWMMASWLRVMSSHVARSWVAGHPACLTWWPSLPMRARAPRTIFLGGGWCLKKGGISCWNSLLVGVNDVSDIGLMTDSGYSGNAKLFWWNSADNIKLSVHILSMIAFLCWIDSGWVGFLNTPPQKSTQACPVCNFDWFLAPVQAIKWNGTRGEKGMTPGRGSPFNLP